MSVNEKGFKVQGPGAGVKSVSPQGQGGELAGPACDYAAMPISGGKVPKKMPAPGMSLAPQNGIMPKVGK